MADYLQALCGNLARRCDDVRIDVSLTPADFLHERAAPLGLIVNELVTNAHKYAFPDRSGTIEVSFAVTANGEGRLHVRDDGVGMGAPRPGSLGTTLVRRLAEQVGGRLEREEVERGTGFAMSFPLVT